MKEIILILTCFLFGYSLGADKVLITLYFESLCPYSKAFITDQLYPTYLELSDVLAVDLVPYGNAKTEETEDGIFNFTCQHGPDECYGNKVESCAVILHREESLLFVTCVEGSNDTTSNKTLENCAETANIPWSKLQDCLDSGVADQLLAAMGRRTAEVHLAYVPTSVINNNNDNVANDTLQDIISSDLKGFICNLLGNEPQPCNG